MPRLPAALFLVLALLPLASCTRGSVKPELWVYTSLYKDTIADLQPRLAAAFPDVKVSFFQAGSEEVAAKVNAEELAGGTKADLLIFSDRFWFEEMARKGRLHKHVPPGVDQVAEALRSKDGFYSAVSLPVMVMIRHDEAVPEAQAPKTFKEMADPKWKARFCTGSPLSSGTNFTTVAFLQKAYGWDYFRALRKNDTISEGGNSAVIRRVQTQERPIGWVLLENALRLPADSKVKVIYPKDGPILQSNVLAITRKDGPRDAAERLAGWFFGREGQEAMTRSFMYAVMPGIDAPKGAPPLSELLATAPKWSPELLEEFMQRRESIKEEFSKIMLQ
jgi:iron(III) transport system substrate-binding protein